MTTTRRTKHEILRLAFWNLLAVVNEGFLQENIFCELTFIEISSQYLSRGGFDCLFFQKN